MAAIVDLHLHSRFARATSPALSLPVLAEWAGRKGIDVLSTADWTHPEWFAELRSGLVEAGDGLYRLRDGGSGARFVFGTEISCVYRQGGSGRRVHVLLFASSMEAAGAINVTLAKHGADLAADGRPTVSFSVRDLYAMALEADPRCFLVPAHAWTPWFGIFGSKTGFDSLEEAFGDLAPRITAVETGLSADPAMHWEVPELQGRQILSFSDAHSAPKLGREVTVLEGPDRAPTYPELVAALGGKAGAFSLAYTVEYFPEEGKYFWSGHRAHDYAQTLEQDLERGTVCPVCGKKLTVGVAYRTALLSGLRVAPRVELPADELGRVFVADAGRTRAPFISAVPLLEILQEALHSPAKAQREYDRVIAGGQTELHLLLGASADGLRTGLGEDIAQAIMKVRRREVILQPGYDGVYGRVRV